MEDPESITREASKLLQMPKKSAEARDKAKEAIEMDPTLIRPWVILSTALLNLREFEQAIEAAEEAIRIDPTRTAAWAIISTCYFRMNSLFLTILKSLKC